MMRSLLATVCCVSFAASAAAQSKELQVLQEAMHKVVDIAEPSIACIMVSRSERYRDFDAMPSGAEGQLGGFDPRPHLASIVDNPSRRELIHRLDLASLEALPESYGSGVVIDKKGLILTNFQVVQNATKIYVRLSEKKGSYANIHAADGRSNLAVLRLISPPDDLKPVRMGDGGKVRKGDFVFGLANPFAAGFRDGGPTASFGVIANVRQKTPGISPENDRSRSIHHLGTLLQTDLRLNPGCSGGSVLNLEGDLIGLTTSSAAIGGETPSGFAVPMTDYIKRIIDVLKRGDEVEYGFLGVAVNTNLVERLGAYIDDVSPGTPAQRAGLRRAELITAVGDAPIVNNDDLFLRIGAVLAGNEVTLTVQDFSGRTRKVRVKLAKFGYPGAVIASNRPQPVHGLRVDYGSVVPLDLPIPEGVFIRDVERGSAAERKYKDLLERGRWIVTHVNGKAVTAPSEFYREANAAKGALELRVVEVVKNPESTMRTLTLP